MSSYRFWRSSRALAAMSLVAVLGLASAYWHAGASGQESGVPTIEKKPVQQAQALSTAFRKAAEVAMPSVVTIRSKTKAQTASMKQGGKRPNPFKGTPFEDMFPEGADGFDAPHGGRREGMGSGVIIDKSGIVLTNNHVVEGADEVVVHLADGREFKAEDIKSDEQTDLAVLRIKNAGDLPVAKLGDSDSMEIGDWVIAIGNPFELEQTVSAGIISGKGRELRSGGQRSSRAKYLQTDAAINPGNSGGPLVDLNGEVVGINTAIATSNGSFQGIGFAIPINQAKWVTTQLVKRGAVERAYLGVAIGDVNRDLANKFGVKRGQGVLISEVYPNTPAAEAGFQVGDVITKFDSHAVRSPRELQELVERVPLGSKQAVEVTRDSKSIHLSVVAKALPAKFGMTSSREKSTERAEPEHPSFESEKLGLEVADVSVEEAEKLGFKDVSGVAISKVDPNGAASEQGLRAGMLIVKVGKKPVKNVKEFEAAIKNETLKDGILLLVRTQTGGNRFVVLQPS